MDAAPPSDADRSTAVEDLKQLLSAGTISSQEFADRSRTVAQARSLAELTAAVRPPVDQSLGSVPGGPATPAPQPLLSTLGGAVTGRPFVGFLARAAGGALVRRLVFLAVSVALAGGGLAYATSMFGQVTQSLPDIDIDVDDIISTQTPGSGPGSTTRDPRLHTTGGLERLIGAIDDEYGRTRYLGAVIYPTYASVELPVSGRPDESRRVFFDGRLGGTSTGAPRRAGSRSADLRDIDVRALVRAVRRAPAQLGVDRVSTTYVVLDVRDGRHVMSVYVSNRANDTGYWTMRLDGTTVRKYRAG